MNTIKQDIVIVKTFIGSSSENEYKNLIMENKINYLLERKRERFGAEKKSSVGVFLFLFVRH